MVNITALILGVLSFIFVAFVVGDYLRGERTLSIAAHVWLKIAIIFAVVALSLAIMS